MGDRREVPRHGVLVPPVRRRYAANRDLLHQNRRGFPLIALDEESGTVRRRPVSQSLADPLQQWRIA